MIIRRAKIEDAKGICETHYDSIHKIAAKDYPSEVLNSWHGGVTELRIEKLRKVLSADNEIMYVCEDDGQIVGFSSIVPAFNELRAVYVKSEYGGKGVGSKLFSALESDAKRLGLKSLQLHSSLTAHSFYEKQGFESQINGEHTLNNGTKMKCVLMKKCFDDAPKIEEVRTNSVESCIEFLESKKETCLFLLGNLNDYGFKIDDRLNSGNYRLLKRHGETVGVFSITRRGNVLIQTDGQDDYSSEIFSSVNEDGIKVKGIIGPWKDSWLFKSFLEASGVGYRADFVSKEKLYSLPLDKKSTNFEVPINLKIRFLEKSDFSNWDVLNRDYLKEEGLGTQGTPEQRKQNYYEKVAAKTWWGLLKDDKLISFGAYNTKYKDIGQIGGVYTIPSERKKGYSKLCMKQLLVDSVGAHKLKFLILFTGEKNIAAQRLYESLGFNEFGHFGLIFEN